MIVNFKCQLDWTTDAQRFGRTAFWVCLWGCLDENNIWTNRPNKADHPPWYGWASTSLLKTWGEQKGWVRGSSTCLLSWETCLFWPSDSGWNIGSPWVSSLLAFRLELIPSPLLVLRPSDSERNYAIHRLSWVPTLLNADLGTYQPPLLCEPIPYNPSIPLSLSFHVYVCMCIYIWFCFSGAGVPNPQATDRYQSVAC